MVLTERSGQSERPGGLLSSFPIFPGVTIFDGALVAVSASGADFGTAINWRNPTGESHFFMGIARINEATGVDADVGEAKTGDTRLIEEVAVDISGVILRAVSVAGASATEVGASVYASDENTFTITATPGAQNIGWISRHYTGTTVDLKLLSAGAFRARFDI